MLYSPKWELDETSKHLLAAADYLEAHGWCRFALEDNLGRVCVSGALLRSTVRRGGSNNKYREALDRLSRFLHRPDPSGWNDYACTDRAEAVATLRAAATSKY